MARAAGRQYAVVWNTMSDCFLVKACSYKLPILIWNVVFKDLQNAHVVALLTQMLLGEIVYRSLQHERVICRNLTSFGEAVLARLVSTRNR